jgi:DNA (cytosine-5)-methyltransferase 1
MQKKINVFSLFSGCGGLDLGFKQAGFNINAAIDNWSDALITHSKNFPNTEIINADLGNFEKSLIEKFRGEIDVVIGGPPCQGFSISGKRDINDPRNNLYLGFLEVLETLSPKAFVMENVPNLVSMGSGEIKNKILNDFSLLGYQTVFKILLASDFGVPQNRKRVFFIGLKNKEYIFPNQQLEVNQRITCSEAIDDLPDLEILDGSKYPNEPRSKYQELMRKNSDTLYNHQLTKHDEKTVKTIALVPDGGNYKNLPKELQDIRKVNIAWTRYGSNKPSLTIDTGHRHHFHYRFNRVPTVRESARLQSFPDDFIFHGSKTSQYKQVGNAVPPLLAFFIAQELKKFL